MKIKVLNKDNKVIKQINLSELKKEHLKNGIKYTSCDNETIFIDKSDSNFNSYIVTSTDINFKNISLGYINSIKRFILSNSKK